MEPQTRKKATTELQSQSVASLANKLPAVSPWWNPTTTRDQPQSVVSLSNEQPAEVSCWSPDTSDVEAEARHKREKTRSPAKVKSEDTIRTHKKLEKLEPHTHDPFIDITPQAVTSARFQPSLRSAPEVTFDPLGGQTGSPVNHAITVEQRRSPASNWWTSPDQMLSEHPGLSHTISEAAPVSQSYTPVLEPVPQRTPTKLTYLQHGWIPPFGMLASSPSASTDDRMRYEEIEEHRIAQPSYQKQTRLSTNFAAIHDGVERTLARGPRQYADNDGHRSAHHTTQHHESLDGMLPTERREERGPRGFPFPGPISLWRVTETTLWPKETVHATVKDWVGGNEFVLYQPRTDWSREDGEYFFVVNKGWGEDLPVKFDLNLANRRGGYGGEGATAQLRGLRLEAGCLTCHGHHADRPCPKWCTILEDNAVEGGTEPRSLNNSDLDGELERIRSLRESSGPHRLYVRGNKIAVVAARDAVAIAAPSAGPATTTVAATLSGENNAANPGETSSATKHDAVHTGHAGPERVTTPPVNTEHEVNFSSPVTSRTIVPVTQYNTTTPQDLTHADAGPDAHLNGLTSPNTNDGDDEATPSDDFDDATRSEFRPSHTQVGYLEARPSEFNQSCFEMEEEGLPTGDCTPGGTKIAMMYRRRHQEELRRMDLEFASGNATGLTPEGPDIPGWLARNALVEMDRIESPLALGPTVTPPGFDPTRVYMPQQREEKGWSSGRAGYRTA